MTADIAGATILTDLSKDDWVDGDLRWRHHRLEDIHCFIFLRWQNTQHRVVYSMGAGLNCHWLSIPGNLEWPHGRSGCHQYTTVGLQPTALLASEIKLPQQHNTYWREMYATNYQALLSKHCKLDYIKLEGDNSKIQRGRLRKL